MLRNELYTGKIVWNRRKWIKRPGTNKRVPRERPRNEWKTVQRPELRIVSPELWQRVQQRQGILAEVYGRAGTGIHKASSSEYLLTGFVKCGLCGGNMIIVAGKGKHTKRKHYGCGVNFNRGACANDLRIELDVLEANYFRRLQTEILTPEVLDYTTREFLRRIREREDGRPDELATLRARQREMEAELGRLAAAVAQIGHSKVLLEAIRSKESELEQISAKLAAGAAPKVELLPANVRSFVLDRLRNIVELVRVNVTKAKAELAKHVTAIRMLPVTGTDGQRHYEAEGEWNLLGEIGLGGKNFAVVAGDRNARKVLSLPYRMRVSDAA